MAEGRSTDQAQTNGENNDTKGRAFWRKKMSHPMCKMLDAGYVQKDSKNEFHKYRYASDLAVSSKFREVMQIAGVYVKSFTIDELKCGTIATEKGESQTATVRCSFTFADSNGNEYGPYQGAGSAIDRGDKHVFKAITGARKYALAQAALISWGDDPEADTTTDKDTAEPVAKSVKPNGPKPKAELSEQAKVNLAAAKAIAPQGMESLVVFWEAIPLPIRRELSGTDEWAAVKKIASQAKQAAEV